MQHRPILTSRQITKKTGMALPTALRNLALLQDLGMVCEVSGKQRNKVFVYQAYLDILNQGTEPLMQ